MSPKEQTVAELLKEAGYATACVGKWHLGDQPEFLPTRQGFEYYFGIPYSNDMGPAEEGTMSSPGQPIPRRKANSQAAATDETGLKGFDQPPLPLLENEKVIERVHAAGQSTITRRYTEKAEQFVRRNKDRPFFLYLPHAAVHFPHYPATKYPGQVAPRSFERLERRGGLERRQNPPNGARGSNLSGKTLVIFTSDNGGPVDQGATNRPLRGANGQTFEGGIRTCTIAWWPGQVPAGTSTSEITTMMDILPTFVKLAGGNLPGDRKIDGHDIWPLLAGLPDARSQHDAFYYYRGLRLEAVRAGAWKLHLEKGALYNLETDLGESTDVATANPDVVKAAFNRSPHAPAPSLALTASDPGAARWAVSAIRRH